MDNFRRAAIHAIQELEDRVAQLQRIVTPDIDELRIENQTLRDGLKEVAELGNSKASARAQEILDAL